MEWDEQPKILFKGVDKMAENHDAMNLLLFEIVMNGFMNSVYEIESERVEYTR